MAGGRIYINPAMYHNLSNFRTYSIVINDVINRYPEVKGTAFLRKYCIVHEDFALGQGHLYVRTARAQILISFV